MEAEVIRKMIVIAINNFTECDVIYAECLFA